MYRIMILTLSLAALAAPARPGVAVSGTVETGFLAVASHKIQLSENGTYFDYRRAGGQDNLFAVQRYTLDCFFGPKHSLTLLYQPLSLDTREVLREDLMVDSLLYPAGTPMRFLYNFPFFRISYLYNFQEGPERELAVGLSFQIRNATIVFESLDGTLMRTNQDIGPVPVLKFRWRKPLDRRFWVGAEADGFYAPISYLNGSNTEVVGAILDGNVRGGVLLNEPASLFLNLRYLGGGAVGQSAEPEGYGDGYVKNWLHFITVTAGFTYFFRNGAEK
jgi:hypothetical protein